MYLKLVFGLSILIGLIFNSNSEDSDPLRSYECELIISIDKTIFSISQDTPFGHEYYNVSNEIISIHGYSSEQKLDGNWDYKVGVVLYGC